MTGQTFILGLNFVFLIVLTGCAAFLIRKARPTDDREVLKLRFAAVTFAGIVAVFIFTAVLFASGSPAGREIFDRAITSMTPLAGVILGYLFGAKAKD